jgi:hypothetical protein
MRSIVARIDKILADLAWSLWSELGVAGLNRQHKQCLISLEELIIITALIAESDPRLRDEALDWCSKYHYLVSISRLRTLVDELGEQIYKSFSVFARTLNSIAQTKWPVPIDALPLPIVLSGKSALPSLEAPALLNLRLRALFGVGIRADLLTFCLTHGTNSFTAIDIQIGYNKRSIAEVLDSFVQSGLLVSSTVGNRRVFTLSKQDELESLLRNLPGIAPDWRSLLELFINLRTILLNNQNFAVSSKVIVARNALNQLTNYLQALNLSPPPTYPESENSWESFCQWLLNTLREMAQNNFWGSFRVESTEIMEKLFFSLMQHIYKIQDNLDGLEFTISYATEDPLKHDIVFKENYAYAIAFLRDLLDSMERLFKFPVYSLLDIKLLEILNQFAWEEFPNLQEDIEKFPSVKEMTSADSALRQYQILVSILNKFHSFMYRFTERLKKLYFVHSDIHLLTLSTELYKRHEIIKLFSELN